MINSSRPTLALPNDRFSIPFDQIPTFVRSSCLKKVQQSGRGSLIAYRHKKSSGNIHKWKIEGIHHIFSQTFLCGMQPFRWCHSEYTMDLI
jgi:hypothetical protein